MDFETVTFEEKDLETTASLIKAEDITLHEGKVERVIFHVQAPNAEEALDYLRGRDCDVDGNIYSDEHLRGCRHISVLVSDIEYSKTYGCYLVPRDTVELAFFNQFLHIKRPNLYQQ